jgi:ADP-ribosylglycohydrolase
MSARSAYRGALLGLATGDALGTTVEFKRPGAFAPVTDMTGGGYFHLEPGDSPAASFTSAAQKSERAGFGSFGR